MAASQVQEVLPPVLRSSSEPPPLFDGTTRLYIYYQCPFAQRAWIARNYKGLQDTIKLVAIDLNDRPLWYKEKVYPENKVPALEHKNQVRGESLELLEYIDKNFEGPALLPEDPAKTEFAKELLSYSDTFNGAFARAFTTKGGDIESEFVGTLDYLENALQKFDDGSFFLGQFSLVDIAYVTFVERYEHFLLDVKNYNIMEGRPKLKEWSEEMNKIDAYVCTRCDPKETVAIYKKRFGV